MEDMRLPIVESPREKKAIIQGSVLPLIRGEGQTNYLCGNCGVTLVEAVREGQLRALYLVCPRCGKYNHID